jgi:hypothetical protein
MKKTCQCGGICYDYEQALHVVNAIVAKKRFSARPKKTRVTIERCVPELCGQTKYFHILSRPPRKSRHNKWWMKLRVGTRN